MIDSRAKMMMARAKAEVMELGPKISNHEVHTVPKTQLLCKDMYCRGSRDG